MGDTFFETVARNARVASQQSRDALAALAPHFVQVAGDALADPVLCNSAVRAMRGAGGEVRLACSQGTDLFARVSPAAGTVTLRLPIERSPEFDIAASGERLLETLHAVASGNLPPRVVTGVASSLLKLLAPEDHAYLAGHLEFAPTDLARIKASMPGLKSAAILGRSSEAIHALPVRLTFTPKVAQLAASHGRGPHFSDLSETQRKNLIAAAAAPLNELVCEPAFCERVASAYGALRLQRAVDDAPVISRAWAWAGASCVATIDGTERLSLAVRVPRRFLSADVFFQGQAPPAALRDPDRPFLDRLTDAASILGSAATMFGSVEQLRAAFAGNLLGKIERVDCKRIDGGRGEAIVLHFARSAEIDDAADRPLPR